MKAIARTIIAVAASLIAAVPVLAEENVMGQQQQNTENRECLLVAKNCPTESIQDRIQRVQGEINRGSDVYSTDEMRRLRNELGNAQRDLELDFASGGA